MDEARATAQRLWRQFNSWYRGTGRGAQIGVAVGALVVVCGCCAVSVNALGSGGGKGGANSSPTTGLTTHQATATNSETKTTATHTTAPTATTISGVTTATLGGTQIMFITAFGPSNNSAGERRDHRMTIQGQDVEIQVALVSADDSSRVRYIRIAPADATTSWSNSQAEAIAKTFLPSDAVYEKDLTVADFGVEHVYTSKLLAASFAASAFQDENGNAVAPGTFYMACGDQTDGSGVCSMQLGE